MDYLDAKAVEGRDHEPALAISDRQRLVRMAILTWVMVTMGLVAVAINLARENTDLRNRLTQSIGEQR